ncbi:hypothetical protein ACJX0J_036046, partial [Zea mays]
MNYLLPLSLKVWEMVILKNQKRPMIWKREYTFPKFIGTTFLLHISIIKKLLMQNELHDKPFIQ